MNTTLYDLEGKKVKTIELPSQFSADYEPVLIKRALLVLENHQKKYGAMPGAGVIGVSGKISRRRRNYKGSYGLGVSRVPRKILWKRGTQFGWVGTQVSGTVKGRRAHPPKAEKNFDLKINKKERKKAIRSALSGIAIQQKIMILESPFETLKKSKEVKTLFEKLGFGKELLRLQDTKIRSGKGKNRGRKYVSKKGPLLVVADVCPLQHAAHNMNGVDIVTVKNLNVGLLTRGNELRQTLWTENAIKKIAMEKIFQ